MEETANEKGERKRIYIAITTRRKRIFSIAITVPPACHTHGKYDQPLPRALQRRLNNLERASLGMQTMSDVHPAKIFKIRMNPQYDLPPCVHHP